ncbi:hypothetical protein NDU88_002335 [Pleurodeles waltl]|uniref:Uncharacterized protein n=1 Tax=Pleurodeles waltl TaxID=8319 RepID=A0AAV7UYK3_PLEWA|nr:hypothetical protein NDU88_002335 [Pleurodeles waltl]
MMRYAVHVLIQASPGRITAGEWFGAQRSHVEYTRRTGALGRLGNVVPSLGRSKMPPLAVARQEWCHRRRKAGKEGERGRENKRRQEKRKVKKEKEKKQRKEQEEEEKRGETWGNGE